MCRTPCGSSEASCAPLVIPTTPNVTPPLSSARHGSLHVVARKHCRGKSPGSRGRGTRVHRGGRELMAAGRRVF
jgi:hypothetical protein